MNASKAEVEELQKRADTYFEVHLGKLSCSNCGSSVGAKGCKGCLNNFCQSCLKDHLVRKPMVQWMYADAGLMTVLSGQGWSSKRCIDGTITALEGLATDRSIRIWVEVKGKQPVEETSKDVTGAIAFLQEQRDLEMSSSLLPKENSEVSTPVEKSAADAIDVSDAEMDGYLSPDESPASLS